MTRKDSDAEISDEPEEVDELAGGASEEDWTPEETTKRRSSGRATAKARKRYADSGDESEEEVSEDDGKAKKGAKGKGGGRGRGRGGARGRGGGRGRSKTEEPPKKKKKSVEPPSDEEEEEEEEEEKESEASEGEEDQESSESDTEVPSEFKSGAYVVQKTDVDDKVEDFPLWKIDGKSLLQKFTKEEEENTYKSTTIYSGWSKTAHDNYYPVSVQSSSLKGKDTIVIFDPSTIDTSAFAKPEEKNDAAKE